MAQIIKRPIQRNLLTIGNELRLVLLKIAQHLTERIHEQEAVFATGVAAPSYLWLSVIKKFAISLAVCAVPAQGCIKMRREET